MKNSKLIEVLSVLNSSEILRLGQFLQSPYLNKQFTVQDKSIELFNFLSKRSPPFVIDKKKAYSYVYENEVYKTGRIEKVMSSLLKQIELFVFVEYSLKPDVSSTFKLSLIDFYRERSLHRLHQTTINNLEKQQGKLTSKNKEDLHIDYRIQKVKSDFESIYNNRTNDLNLQSTLKTLDIYYIASRLEMTCALLAQTNFHHRLEISSSIEILDSIQSFFQQPEFKNVPLIEVYSLVYKILKEPKEEIDTHIENIKKLESVLYSQRNKLGHYHLVNLHSFNRSFLLYNLNLGRKDLNSYAFKMYKDHLQKKLLDVDEGIHSAHFKNIVSIALKENHFDWVLKFLNEYKGKIKGTEYPAQVHQFNLANYYFHIKEIDKAQELLGQEYEDLYYKLAAKRLEIKIYYEQKSELLEYKLNAFKQFIHRLSKNKLPEIVRTNNNNFINALKQILSSTNNTSTKRKRIKLKIENMEAVKDKDWLLSVLSKSWNLRQFVSPKKRLEK